MTPEELFKALDLKENLNRPLADSLKSALKFTFVEEFVQGDERPCEDSDFVEFKKFQESHIKFFFMIIKTLIQRGDFNHKLIQSSSDNEILAFILIMCGENSQNKPWNTEITVKNCELIINEILKVFDCRDITSLVEKNKSKLIKNILHNIRPKLLKNTWKHFPATVACYSWFLQILSQSELSIHLHSLLPTALLLVDDFVNENRIVGIHCLNYIVNNLTMAELQFHGYGNVIYSALLPLFRIRQVNICDALTPCMAALSTKLETDLGKKVVAKWSSFDDILEIYLENMELEQQLDLRNSYIKNLILLVSDIGYDIIRWTKRLLKIFNEYLQNAGKLDDHVTTNYCLKVIQKFIEVTKPACNLYSRQLQHLLLIPLYNSPNNNSALELENKEIAMKAIHELPKFSDNDKKELIDAFHKKLYNNIQFYNILTKIFEYQSTENLN